jgi:hypothetical protein
MPPVAPRRRSALQSPPTAICGLERRTLGQSRKTSVTEGHERLSFPSAIFIDADGERHGVWGYQPVEAYRGAAARFGRLAVPEAELLAETEPVETQAQLWRLAAEAKLEPVSALTGTLFQLPAAG